MSVEMRKLCEGRPGVAGKAAAVLVALLALAPTPGSAQHASPYAGQEGREIASLSPEEVGDLEAGAGMGFARPAELNGYPGPRHVLDMADELDLGDDQRRGVQSSYDRMHRRAVAAGQELIEAERALSVLFGSSAATPASLEAAVSAAAEARARVRLAHLEAHLETRALLTAAQVEAYARLRGYADGGHDPSRHH